MSGFSSTSDGESENASVSADADHVTPELRPDGFRDELLSFLGAEDDVEMVFVKVVEHFLCRPCRGSPS